MKCCKCREYGWEDGLDIVYTDDDGKGYCVFHAPKDEKGISVEEFNELVFARIDAFKEAHPIVEGEEQAETCNCAGVVFPGDISFSSFAVEKKIPQITFLRAAFSGDTSFMNAAFSGGAGFVNAAFSGAASFRNAAFSGGADFDNCFVNRKVTFTTCKFQRKSFFRILSSSAAPVCFQKIDEESLSHLYFTAAEVENISFVCCELPECFLVELENTSSYSVSTMRDWWRWLTATEDQKEAEELYRALKQKADKDGDKGLVSKWHYREKRMALRQIPRWRWPLTATGWYGLSSGYGERPVRASLVLLAMIVLTMFCLNWIGIVPNSAAHISENGVDGINLIQGFSGSFDWTRFGLLIGSTFEHLLFFKAPMYVPQASVATGFLSFLTKLLIPVQAALFAFALRNRFRR